MTLAVREITTCRACDSSRLEEVLDLGVHAISDFVEDGSEPDRAPLVLVRCVDCTLVQLLHTVPRERLYSRYWYRSSTNESMVAALKDVVDDAASHVQLRRGDVWLDIGANDGTLLRQVKSLNPDVVRMGFEPAQNLFDEASEGGNVILPGFFPPGYGVVQQAKVITSIAMFYDLDDPNGFVAAVRKWLHPDGAWVIQMSTLGQMIDQNAFDNICHEHLEYYSLGSLQNLLLRHDLRIAAFSANQVNGGSIRVIVKHGALHAPWSEFPLVGSQRDVATFAARVRGLKAETQHLLHRLRREGRSVLGYGASTKGNTLLQYYEITPDILPAIADRNPDKWGRRTAGTGIPIISEEEMRGRRPDYLLALPWHFMSSFSRRERAFLERGGRFIVPLPTLKLEGLDANISAENATPGPRPAAAA